MTGVCIMTETRYRERLVRRVDDNQKVSGGTGSKTTHIKKRDVVAFIMPDFKIQWLNPGQLSNLAALGVNRIPTTKLEAFDRSMMRFRLRRK